MEVIRLQQLKKSFADRDLFDLPTLTVNSGDRIALIGKNGQGKSSLFKILAGLDTDYEGQVIIRGDIAYVPQLKEVSSQSGGEQVRAYLQAAFAQRPDILLLDEPSANLDQSGQVWLISQLRRFRGTLLLVSHDRYLINQLAEKIWYLNGQTITVYPGNYADFESFQAEESDHHERDYKAYRAKADALKRSAEAKERKAQKLTKRKKSISSSEWKARSFAGAYDAQQKAMAKSAKSMQHRLDKLERVDKPKAEKQIKLKEVGQHLAPGGSLIHLKSGQVWADDNLLFDFPDWLIKSGEKIILSGDNQSGKTTFVRQLFAQDLEGSYSPRLKAVYYAQNFDALDVDKTALVNLTETSSQDRETLINLLTALGLSYQQVHANLHHLSGGERVKVQLAKALSADANLLILDEPTNYLDLATIQSLENFLSNYQGAVILISHDRAFLDKIQAREFRIIDHHLREVSRGEN